MQRIKMLKTACGPNGSFASGKKYTVDDDTAEAWCAKPSPAAVLVEECVKQDFVIPGLSKKDAAQAVMAIGLGEAQKPTPKPRAKRAAKYRPGKDA